MAFKLGEKYKSYALWDFDQIGDYDVFEVVETEDELAFYNHTDGCVYDLGFLGSSELVKI